MRRERPLRVSRRPLGGREILRKMGEQLRSIVLGTTGLSVAGVIALWLTLTRHGIGADKRILRSAVRVAAAAIVLQTAHFGEELATGFDDRFPRLLGLTPWSPVFFVSFNVFWLIVWAVSIWGVRARRHLALFPLWFLGLGCLANGFAHPGFAVLSGGYFPGLVTAPFVGIVGVLLLRRLSLLTVEPDTAWPPNTALHPTPPASLARRSRRG
jgi:hypothetical protein